MKIVLLRDILEKHINPLKIFVFIAFCVVGLILINNIIQPQFRIFDVGGDSVGYDDRYCNFYNETEGSLDGIFLGASTNLLSCIPIELYRNWNYTAYQLSSGSQSMWVSYYWLLEANKHHDLKFVVLDVSTIFKQDYEYDMDYKSAKCIKSIWNRIRALYCVTKYENPQHMYTMFPFFRFHDRWKDLNFSDFDRDYSAYPEFYKGAIVDTHIGKWEGLQVADKKYDIYSYNNNLFLGYEVTEDEVLINENQSFYFDKIKEYCDANNIELVCIKGPAIAKWSHKRHEVVENYLNIRNIDFYDFNEVSELVEINNDDYVDGGFHTNYFGAVKVTNAIGKILDSNAISTCSRIGCWDDELSKYLSYVDDLELTNSERFINELCNTYSSLDKQLLIICVKNDVAINNTSEITNTLKGMKLTVNPDDIFQKSYIAIINDRNVLFEKSSDNTLVFQDYVQLEEANMRIEVVSGGYSAGDCCILDIDDTHIESNSPGYNCFLFDEDKKSIIRSFSYFPYLDIYKVY